MNRLGVTFLVAAQLFILSVAAFAQERQGAVSLSPFIGGYTFDGTQHALTRPVYGLRLGYDVTRNWGVEGVFDYVASETTQQRQDFRAYSYRLDVLYNFMPDRVLVPYLAVGGGGVTFEDEADNENTDATFNFGGGVKYYITDSVAVRGDVRQILLFEGDDRGFNNWEYTVGMTFLFGGTRPAMMETATTPPPAPAPPVAPAPVPPPAAEQPPLQPAPAAEPTPEKAKYCISLNILFDIDQAEIRDEFRDEVGRVGTFMQKFPTTTAVIEGHADEVGTDEHNMELSQRRAESVVNYLVNSFGIDRSRLTARGYGKTRPIADNRTEQGRQKNRRIDAIIDCALDIKGLTPVPDKLCLNLKLEFDNDRADIKPQFEPEVAKVADFMKANPTVTALIEGHTDNSGTPAHNLKLSQMRAESVVNYLVQKFGIDRSRLAAKGFGDTRRVAYNTTSEGRAQNRRVNVILDCVLKK